MHLLKEHDDFRRLWLAQTISQIGSQVSYLAVPLTAAVTLDATPFEMGLLTAAGSIPSLVVGLLAGVLVDRRDRRPVLVSADLARAILLGVIPLAWLLGMLNMPLLYAVAFLGGLCALFFDLAYGAFLPALVDRDDLMEGNSNLELSRSAAEIIGPALAGGLIQLLRAPVALALDAVSFLASALLIARIRTTETVHRLGETSTSVWADAKAGVQGIHRSAPVRALAVSAIGIGVFNAMTEAVAILYLTRTVGMEPGVLGIVFAAGSVGFVAGAMMPARLASRFGVGPTMGAAMAVIGLSDLAIPLVGHNLLVVSGVVALSQFLFGIGVTVFNVTQRTLLQAVVPQALLGRVGGVFRMIGSGMAPAGAIVGGILGTVIDLQPTLVLAALLETAVALWIWRSPLWSYRAIEPGAVA